MHTHVARSPSRMGRRDRAHDRTRGTRGPAAAQSRLVLPAGSVILVRTTAPLQSASAQSGQTFETTVDQSVGVDEYTIIPAGAGSAGRSPSRVPRRGSSRA